MNEIKNCLLVEDQIAYREWLLPVLQQNFPYWHFSYAENLRKAMEFLESDKANNLYLALLDIGLPDGSGIDIVRFIRANSPNTLCVIATIYDDDHHLFEALSAGAHGYLLKDKTTQLIAQTLQRIENGEPPLSPAIARRLLGHFGNKGIEQSNNGLTPREIETLTLIARGLTSGEVAKKLGLSAQTIASYIKIIYQKLNVNSRAQATLKAAQMGLVDRNSD